MFADYLVIMGYDEHIYTGDPGPGASLSFVQQGIEDTLELIGGDASKVINALPFLYPCVGGQRTVRRRQCYYATMPQARAYLQKVSGFNGHDMELRAGI